MHHTNSGERNNCSDRQWDKSNLKLVMCKTALERVLYHTVKRKAECALHGLDGQLCIAGHRPWVQTVHGVHDAAPLGGGAVLSHAGELGMSVAADGRTHERRPIDGLSVTGTLKSGFWVLGDWIIKQRPTPISLSFLGVGCGRNAACERLWRHRCHERPLGAGRRADAEIVVARGCDNTPRGTLPPFEGVVVPRLNLNLILIKSWFRATPTCDSI